MYKLSLSAAAVLLAGCATTAEQCDPSNKDIGFFGKIQCDVGGGYADSVSKSEQALIEARAENQHFQEIYEQIAEQQRDTKASLAIQQERNRKLSQSLSTLLNQVKSKNANKAEVQQQIAAVEAKLKTAQATPTDNTAAKQAELRQLQSQLQRLQLSLGYE